MAKSRKTAKSAKAQAPQPSESLMSKAGHVALDNPVAAGGSVVMGLTACLIVANAIGLQPGRHPAPLFATRDRPEAFQMPEPDGRSPGLKIQEISTLVLDLQISLRKAGLYEGPLDGLNGPATERAIRSFERRAGQVGNRGGQRSLAGPGADAWRPTGRGAGAGPAGQAGPRRAAATRWGHRLVTGRCRSEADENSKGVV